MQWTLSDEQVAYQETLRGWLRDVAPARTVREWWDAADSVVFEQRLVSDGWSGVGVAEDVGGQGGGLVELVLTAEEFARGGVPSAAWLATMLAVPALTGRRDLVEAALGGHLVVPLVPAEEVPSAPIELAFDDGRISAVVPRVLAADRADSFVVVVESEGERSLRLVDRNAPGVTVVHRRLLDRSRSLADVRLDSVPSEPLMADADDYLAACAARAAVLVGADSLGATERMLDLAVEYSKQRHQFGVQIGSFQAVKHAAASMLVGIEAGRSVLYYAAASVEGHNAGSALHAAAVKAQLTAEGDRAADSALTLHGAIGYTWEHELQIFYKRAKLDKVLYGDPVAWNDRIADGLALA